MKQGYYRLVHQYKGHHYFKVEKVNEPILKITFGVQPKKGRPWCPGITNISYNTFISSYAWQYTDSNTKPSFGLKKISKQEFDTATKIMLKALNIR